MYWGIFFFFGGLILIIFSLILLKNILSFLICLNLLKLCIINKEIFFILDWMNLIFIRVVIIISGCVIIYSHEYIINEGNKIGFCYIIILFVIRMIFIVIRNNIWFIMLGWDGLGIISYCLIIYYNGKNSSNAGIITVLRNRLGDIGIMIRIIFMVDLRTWIIKRFCYISIRFNITMFIVVMGAITKRAQFPFRAWLPAAMAAPTPVSSLVHSSTLVTAGVYLIIRFNIFFTGGIFSDILLILSILTLLLAGIGGLLENDIKKIIALSTLRQLGLIIVTLSFGGIKLAFFHLLTHAMFKAILFICAGVIIHLNGGNQDIRVIGGMGLNNSVLVSAILLGSLSLRGVPFLRGFYSKDLLLEIIYINNLGRLMIVILVVGVMLTLIYSFRLLYYTVWIGVLGVNLLREHDLEIILISIILMRLGVIFMGSCFSWMIFRMDEVVTLSFLIKIFNINYVVMGLLIYIYVFSYFWRSRNFQKWRIFLGGIWFLPLITRRIFLKNILFYGKIVEVIDYGWLENISGGGVIKIFNNFFFYELKVSLKINEILILILLIIILFI